MVNERIVVEMFAHASAKQRRELGAFIRYCVFRLEREFGELNWLVRISLSTRGYTSLVAVNDQATVVEARGVGFDGSLAAWEALNNVEQALRESRARKWG